MNTTASNDDEPIVWLSTGESADLLGVSMRVLYQRIDDGDIPAYRIGRVIRLQQQHVVTYRDRGP